MHTVSPMIPNHTPDEQNKQQENGARPFSEGFKTAAAVNSRPKTNTDSIEDEAWHFLRAAMVYYCGGPVGTIAANDLSEATMLKTMIKYLYSWEKTMDWYSPGQGLMPASFKVRTVPLDNDESATEDVLDPDFGEAAIGRVAPVDSGLWWIILLRAYGKCSGDVQTGIKMVLRLCLADGFDMFLLDISPHVNPWPPLEIQALYYSALFCAREMLAPEEASTDLVRALNNRLLALPWSYHNGGSWPTLLWQLTVACIKMKRPEIAEKAIKVAERRLARDRWPEYYDTKRGGFIGKQARLFQTWSIAGYLVAKLLIANPEAAKMVINVEDTELLSAFSSILSSNPRRKRSRKGVKQFSCNIDPR
ncbi:hypothetical protein K7X08_027990 [Anisodus acutangulus]|uniref:Alkaline/neutral invertase n=1 Tax=Anisodus acutangulus TaxID=402998 RepID=A0A9Q1MZY9_9SOLA|nr:hypothetical protein K7X08_027990 [Anisodus acutangulus]